MCSMESKLLTPEEAAKYLRVSLSTIYRYLTKNQNPLPSKKINKNVVRIDLSELHEWLQQFNRKGGEK